jgi:hypothetical protein
LIPEKAVVKLILNPSLRGVAMLTELVLRRSVSPYSKDDEMVRGPRVCLFAALLLIGCGKSPAPEKPAPGQANLAAPAARVEEIQRIIADAYKDVIEQSTSSSANGVRYALNEHGDAYQMKSPSPTELQIEIRAEQEILRTADGRDRQVTHFSGTLTPHKLLVASKPTPWYLPKPGERQYDFRQDWFPPLGEAHTYLMPWSDEVQLPSIPFQISLTEEGRKCALFGNALIEAEPFDKQEAVKLFTWVDVPNARNEPTLKITLSDLRPLTQRQMANLLDLDLTPLLSEQGAAAYKTLQEIFHQVAFEDNGSYLIINELGITRGFVKDDYDQRQHVKVGDRSNPLGLQMLSGAKLPVLAFSLGNQNRKELHDYFCIDEIRGGTHQIWLEEVNIPDLDAINGVTLRAAGSIAISGYARRRYLVVNIFRDGTTTLENATEWGDWVPANTYVGRFRIETKNGVTTWEGDVPKGLTDQSGRKSFKVFSELTPPTGEVQRKIARTAGLSRQVFPPPRPGK